MSSKTYSFGYTSDGGYSQTDAIGQPITVTDNVGKVTHLRYDSRGNRTSVTDALGNETDTSYNLANQPLTTTLPATGQTGSGHGTVTNAYLFVGGPMLSETTYDESAAQARQVTHTYGAEGEMLTTTGSTEPVAYTYDAQYRVVGLTDGNDHTTTYTFDTIGNLTLAAYPNANSSTGYDETQFPLHDNLGNALERIDGRAVETDYAYNDPASAMTAMDYPANTGDSVHITYDVYGRRTAMTDAVGSHAYTFDDNNTLLSNATTYSGLAEKTVSYTFNPDGSRLTMVIPSGTFSYSRDGDSRMHSLVNPFGETSSWTYLDNGLLGTQELENGSSATVATTTYSYNALGEMTELLNQDGESTPVTLSQFGGAGSSSMAYDAAQDRTSVPVTVTGNSGYSGVTSYSYADNSGHTAPERLTGESSTRLGGYSQSSSYDGAGNPTTFTGSSNSFNSDNQNTANAYDGDGNPTTCGSATCAFDEENRTTSLGTALTCGYDADGLRAWKDNGSSRTFFLYDGAVPLCELDSSGSVIATDTCGVNGIVSRNSVGTPTFYTFDGQGSVSQRLTATDTVSSTDAYTAWGSRTSTGSSDVFSYDAQWGCYTDGETGLILCGMRYYNPSQGSWLTRDPIGYRGGINLYSYCADEAADNADPLGTSYSSCLAGCRADRTAWILAWTALEIVCVAVVVGIALYFKCPMGALILAIICTIIYGLELIKVILDYNTCVNDCYFKYLMSPTGAPPAPP